MSSHRTKETVSFYAKIVTPKNFVYYIIIYANILYYRIIKAGFLICPTK